MRGLFDRFMAAVQERMKQAVRQIERMNLGVENLTANIEGKFITLRGVAPSRDVAARVIEHFKRMMGADNILDKLKIADPHLHNHQQ